MARDWERPLDSNVEGTALCGALQLAVEWLPLSGGLSDGSLVRRVPKQLTRPTHTAETQGDGVAG